MATTSGIRDKLKTKIFDKFGTTATRKAVDTSTTDKWGDATTTYFLDEEIVVVPFNYITSRLSYQPFGDLQENEVAIVVEWDQEVETDDVITYNNVDYRVVEVEEFIFQEVVAKSVRLSEK